MLKRFLASAYTKAALVLLVCGALLIVFHNWISGNQISLGLETLNKTLAPVYIGTMLAFIVCPVYNACVKFTYEKFLNNSARHASAAGAKALPDFSDGAYSDRDEKRRILTIARVLATLVCIILVVGLFGLIIYFVAPQLVQTGIGLANTLPQRLTKFSDWLEIHFPRLPQLAEGVDNIANAGTDDIIAWVQKNILSGNAMSIASMISSGVMTAVKYVANLFVGLLIMVYLLNYKERLFAITRKIITATCEQKRQDRLYEFADVVNETFIGFIVGRIIDSFIIGVLTFVVMKIFGISFALMISVIVGVTNIIPFFGPFIGAIPSIFLLLLERPIEAFYFIIIILLIQQLDGNVIGPKIVGNAIGISSFWVLIAVLVGGGLFGFGGMALGVPVFAVIYRYVDKLTMRSLGKREKPEDTNDYFNLDVYGISEKEISLEHEKKEQESFFTKLRKGNIRSLSASASVADAEDNRTDRESDD